MARKLADAPTPLIFAAVKRGLPGLPRGNSPRAAGFDELVVQALRGSGRYPSGPGQADRYWGKDEAQVLRDAALAAAREPKTIAQLVTASRTVTGSIPGFAEELVRGLIGEDKLHEYKVARGFKYGSVPPPPPPPPLLPLQRSPFKRRLATALDGLAKLLDDSGASTADLMRAIHTRLGIEPPTAPTRSAGPALPESELDALILDRLRTLGPGRVESIAELRRTIPAGSRGEAFNEAVFRLTDAKQVAIYQDSNPAALSADERAEYLPDQYGHVFKTIALRGPK